MVTTVNVTGYVKLPDNSEASGAVVTFQLSASDYDTAGDTAIPKSKTSVTLGSGGSITAPLWPNDRGTVGTYYFVDVIWTNSEGKPVSARLGTIQPVAAGPNVISDLLAVGNADFDGIAIAFLTDEEYQAAIAAADILQAGVTYHNSTAEGLAATASGDYFIVKQSGGLADYLNDGGSATFNTWIKDPVFNSLAALIADAGLTADNAPIGYEVVAGGDRYKVVASGEDLTTAGGVKFSRVYDKRLQFDSVARPSDFTASAGAAGNLTGQYTWAMTYVDEDGNETEPSPRIGPVTLSGQRGALTGLSVSDDPRVVARRIYRTAANPADVLFLKFVAEIDNVATSYTDNLVDGSLGDPIPWIDTTGGVIELDGQRVGNFKGNTLAFGQYAGGTLTGYANTWFGNYAGQVNVEGLRNCGFGVYALAGNTDGLRNTAVGVHSLNDNANGSDSTAIGYGAGFHSLNGAGTYVGAYAGGSSNDPMTAIGAFSMIQNVGRDHVAVGAYTGWSNISGSRCVYVGNYAGYHNTISDAFILDNRQRVNEADEHDKALLYGRFGVGIGDQFLKVNGALKSANCQGDTTAMPNGSSAGGAMNTDGALYYSIGASTTNSLASIYYGGGGLVGVISVDGTSTSFTSLSDERAKQNIVDAPSAADAIAAIKIRSFDWRNGGGHVDYGVIAQELHNVRPDAVVAGDDEMPWTADTSKLIPLLIKALQEAHQEIAEIKRIIEDK